jgi:hypothetical protein
MFPEADTHTITHFKKKPRKKLLFDPINPFQNGAVEIDDT